MLSIPFSQEWYSRGVAMANNDIRQEGFAYAKSEADRGEFAFYWLGVGYRTAVEVHKEGLAD